MKVDARQNLKDKFFYNNLMLFISIFCIACFCTYFSIEKSQITSKYYSNIKENSIYGPIVVKKGQAKICEIKSAMYEKNRSIYFSGEVLDEDKETLYEFGKELWHEDGYDSEGYWIEADTNMSAKLSFTEPGKYYIQFHTDEKAMNAMGLQIIVKRGSGIPHLMVGTYALIFVIILFILLNGTWVFEELEKINDLLEELSDD